MRRSHLEALRPYLIGSKPNSEGEWPMYCPLHEDTRQSAGLNVKKGMWTCHQGCPGGDVRDLLLKRAAWVPPPTHRGGSPTPKTGPARAPAPTRLDDGQAREWHMRLRKTTRARMRLKRMRGLNEATIRKHEIGWDTKQQCYTLPVRLDNDMLCNVRFYDPVSTDRKMWSVRGHGSPPQLYPVSVLLDDPSYVIITEGEMDALLTNQHGFPAVTRTASALTWHEEWGRYFKGRIVYVCQDMDKAGQDGNVIIARSLAKWAREVRVIKLPYEVAEKHGKDLTDFWKEHNATTFRNLMEQALPLSVEVAKLNDKPQPATLLEAHDAANVGKALSLNVTIKGRRDPGYSLPYRVRFNCEVESEAARCANCPLNRPKGELEAIIAANDPRLLEMIDVGKKQLNGVLKEYAGISCKRVEVDVVERQSVELVYGRPSVDNNPTLNGAGDYKTIKITSTGRHDTMPNTTVQVVGSLYPNPRSQSNEFLAWLVRPVRTSIDTYQPDAEMLKALKRFQPRGRQTPLAKAAQIAKEMSLQVTHIYGRVEMHVLMDLIWHSSLGFKVGRDRLERGWLDGLIVGDTRTGKSEAAKRLSDHYLCGEIISCESASYAGIVGGVQQVNGNAWVITWGTIPLNDRRLVVLDEVGGLTREEIARMSDVRSSGKAELMKIVQERTHARTRLLWLGNPRNGRMSDYTYGVQAIEPLIGNPEDIARFDLAMSVHSDDVDMSEINRQHDAPPVRYDSEVCHSLIRWVWSRQPDQVVWTKPAHKTLLDASKRLASRYIEVPPLIQGANVRYKLARIATALAGRTFSTDHSYERLVVLEQHVKDAVAFLEHLYNLPSFGYADVSADRLKDLGDARKQSTKMRNYLRAHPGLGKFLRMNNTFRRPDLEEFLDMSREQANGVINTLWGSRMVRKEAGDIRVEPALHEILRDREAV